MRVLRKPRLKCVAVYVSREEAHCAIHASSSRFTYVSRGLISPYKQPWCELLFKVICIGSAREKFGVWTGPYLH